MTRHKHCEVIKAWAEGAEIQVRHDAGEMWRDVVTDIPSFLLTSEYRIKPKTVKREGWVNIYKVYDRVLVWGGQVHATEDIAKRLVNIYGDESRIATIKIEWTEEE